MFNADGTGVSKSPDEEDEKFTYTIKEDKITRVYEYDGEEEVEEGNYQLTSNTLTITLSEVLEDTKIDAK